MSDLRKLLHKWGYAYGDYDCICDDCKLQHHAAKRAWRCLPCALKRNRLEEEKMSEWMNFGEALAFLKDGMKVTRRGWNGKGMYLQIREEQSMTRPRYIEMSTVECRLIPWLASQTDMLAEDWRVVK